MRKSAKYFLNNNGKKLLAASVMALLLSGSAQPVLAADLDGTANGKLAEVNTGDVYGHVYGVTDGSPDPGSWKQTDALAEGGLINMQGGEAFNMYGGTAYVLASKKAAASANGNTVNVTGGKTAIALYGGIAQGYSAESSGNGIKISGGETGMDEEMMPYAVVGGWVNALGKDAGVKAAANNNIVTITGGVVNNSVYGAYLQGMHTAQFNADNNIVSISGDAKVNGKIYAAYISVSDSESSAAAVSEKADNNMVIVSGNADISNAALHGIGSSGSSGGKISGSGNTLVINGWHGSVKTVDGFNNVVFKEVAWQDNGKVLNITDGKNSSLEHSVLLSGNF